MSLASMHLKHSTKPIKNVLVVKKSIRFERFFGSSWADSGIGSARPVSLSSTI